ncbi:hypothetical protein K2Y11_00330 [bacterium]|nr:hypothetical protein [bacterium]
MGIKNDADSSRLSNDVEAMLKALFPRNKDEVRTLLLGYAGNETDRVRKGILEYPKESWPT